VADEGQLLPIAYYVRDAADSTSAEPYEDEAYAPRPGARIVGVGPHPQPWPDDPRLDPVLLAEGDHRNVLDKYRYWSVAAIKADLETSRSRLHIAIENLEHDLNIGSIVRSGNAFNVGGIHIVGRRRWNKRGALVTDRYMDIYYHPDAADLASWARDHDYALVAIDNPPDSVPIEDSHLPENCILVFGQESSGISPELLAVCGSAVRIEQFGSTRSLNVAAAAAIAMHWWIVQHPGRGASK
jgi:tRNA G18 (ribose-2'-O)-methylase SpoU